VKRAHHLLAIVCDVEAAPITQAASTTRKITRQTGGPDRLACRRIVRPQERELWLDTETSLDEQKFYIGHMRVEYHLREKGVDQDAARKRADTDLHVS